MVKVRKTTLRLFFEILRNALATKKLRLLKIESKKGVTNYFVTPFIFLLFQKSFCLIEK